MFCTPLPKKLMLLTQSENPVTKHKFQSFFVGVTISHCLDKSEPT
jgi:hypothetical protein